MNMLAVDDVFRISPAFKWFWVAGAAVGVITNLITYVAALRDAGWVKNNSRNEAKHIQAWQSLRTEFVTLCVQGAFLWIRVWTLFWPRPADPWFARNWATDATALTVFQLLLAYNSWMSWKDRRRSLDLLRDPDTRTRKGD